MAPRTQKQQTSPHILRVKKVAETTAGKRRQAAVGKGLELFVRVYADLLYGRFEEAHRTLGHDPEAKFYDNSVVATTFLDFDLGGNGERVVLPKTVRPNALPAASVQMMKKD
jgi:hypothetical protein